ncbi:MAG: nicotinate-nucleotide--dimethylbenzimidazole phosphoribosyltransferase [Ilumatobacteraceae bacterium]
MTNPPAIDSTRASDSPSHWLRAAMATMPERDEASFEAVTTRAAEILRPSGALARLDDVAAWAAGWQRTTSPAIRKPAALIFAADHGVTAAGVSKYPTDVTGAMLAAYRAGKSTINAFAAVAGASVEAIDVGVGRPTGDIRYESAMSPQRFDEAVAAGRGAVDRLDADLLVLGEMGIGNTTAAAAVAAALGGGEVAAWVGRGTGVDDEGLSRKREAVREAVTRIVGVLDPFEVLREVGGAELVAMAAAIVAARHRKLPVLIDGYVVTAAALPLASISSAALAHCLVGHCSSEPGHRRLLDRLGKQPLLDLEMRLGEGSGAMAAVPLVAMACAGITEVPTFGEWFG